MSFSGLIEREIDSIEGWGWVVFTFLLRQDLQFMASRGSTVARRGVRRSILTCGRDIAH